MKTRTITKTMAIAAMVVITLVATMNAGAVDAGEIRVMERVTDEGAMLMGAMDVPEPTSIIVRYADKTAPSSGKTMVSANSAQQKYADMTASFGVVEVGEGESIQELIDKYEARGDVLYAEPNYMVRACMIPNDPGYPLQWHLNNQNYGGINAECAWDISTGDGIVVAVLDTGVAYEDYDENDDGSHDYLQAPDLAGTTFVQGYDYVNNDGHPNDDHGHGTHVTGTIAQTTNNNLGIAGVAFNCSIMPMKVLNASGFGDYSDINDAIRNATDEGADVISMSFGGPDKSQTLQGAINYAHENGVILVAAAGNSGSGADPSYPAACNHVIAVGATQYDETVAYYSSRGWWVDIAAPGGNVYLDQNNDTYGDGVLQQTFVPGDPTNFSYYWFYQGTSMACPHVSGTAALLLADGRNSTDIEYILTRTAEDHGPDGWDGRYGWGIVDACAALTTNLPTPVHNLDTGENFGRIQDAIGAPNTTKGHTITVDPGTYDENVRVRKQLTIRSTSGDPADTIVKAANQKQHVFRVNADYVNISGFNVTGATGSGKAGIRLSGADHCNISGNSISGNGQGIRLWNADDNNITCNWVHENRRGFHFCFCNGIHNSTGNNISYNNIVANTKRSIYNKQKADVNATNNWWGTNNDTAINASIYDWQNNRNKGNVTYLPKLGQPAPCAPVPELPTVALLAVGLLALVGYVRNGRKT